MTSQRLLTVYLVIGTFTSLGSLRGLFYIGKFILHLVPDRNNLYQSKSTDKEGWILWQNNIFLSKVMIDSDNLGRITLILHSTV